MSNHTEKYTKYILLLKFSDLNACISYLIFGFIHWSNEKSVIFSILWTVQSLELLIAFMYIYLYNIYIYRYHGNKMWYNKSADFLW